MRPEASTSGGNGAMASVLAHLHNLLRKEAALFKSEMADSINRAAVAVGLIGLALVLVMIGLNVLAGAAAAALIEAGLSPAQAALSIAVACLLIAAAVGWKALKMLKSASFVPHATIETIKDDVKTLKEKHNA